uniref:Uncharacterized protein n=1 Tax=Oncorhynchus tshawytscha TaxID=74940 RepID=A0AAZ3Q412_ONCTS
MWFDYSSLGVHMPHTHTHTHTHTRARQRLWSWKLYDELLLSCLSKQADQEVGVTCCQEEEHNEEMEWITSRNPSFCIWRERKDEEDSL